MKQRKCLCPAIAWGMALLSCILLADIAQAQQPQGDVNIIQTQSREPQARLDARIASMPKVQRKLEIIHNRSQLIQTRLRVTRMAIADPSVLDVAPFEEREFAIVGTQLGTTTLTLWFEGDSNPLIYEVTVIKDPSLEEQRRIDYGKLERKIAILFPNSKVYLIPLHEKIVVKGQAKDAAEAARILQIIRGEYLDQYGGLYGPGGSYGRGGDYAGGAGGRREDEILSNFIVNMLQVPGEFQVMLHVTIAELNRTQMRRLGVNINVLFGDGAHMITSAISGGVPTLTGIFENGDVAVLINALASNGTAKILSRPSLTTLSGHPAQFLAGGEFAVPTIVGVAGAQGTSTQFRGFGTSMTVVPTVVDSDLIRLRISPEFSQINPNNSVQGVPGLDSRRVQTTVELREGQTIVLGGLLSRQSSTEVSRIPWLGELPWVGPMLFNTKRASEDELELIVLVTPELVRAMNPDEVPPMPGYYVTHPNDRELYRYAMTEGAPDMEVYQLAPYGNKVGVPDAVGFNLHNPSPATPQYAPIPQANQPNGFPTPSPWTEQSSRYGGNQYQQHPGQMIPGQFESGQPMQVMPGQPMPGQQMPGQHYPGHDSQLHPQTMNAIPSPAMAPHGQQYGQQHGQPYGQQYGQPVPMHAPPAYQQQMPGMAPSQMPSGNEFQQAPQPHQGLPPQNFNNPQLGPIPDSGQQSYRGGVPTASHMQPGAPRGMPGGYQPGNSYPGQTQQMPGRQNPGHTQPVGYPAGQGR